MPGLLRSRATHDAKVSNVELFFDLVFVFAVTQLSHSLLAHPSLVGVLQTAMLFMGVWWVWVYTSWVTNWLDPERPLVRLLLFTLMIAGLFLSMSLPKAWQEKGLVFAGSYVFMQVGRSLFTTLAVRRHSASNFRNFIRITIWLAASGALWLTGGLMEGHLRFALWGSALVLEYLGPSLYFHVPGLGRSSTTDWDIEGSHLAERCGLFIIIALGESVLVTGATAADLPWNGTTIAAFAANFFGSVAMWWLYFNIGAERASHVIAKSRDPGALARLAYTYIHLLLVGGIIVSAAADELVLAHPHGHVSAEMGAFGVGGPALYLFGNLLFKRATSSRWPLSHMAGLAACAGLYAALPALTPLYVGVATTMILAGVGAWETLSLRTAEGPAHDRS